MYLFLIKILTLLCFEKAQFPRQCTDFINQTYFDLASKELKHIDHDGAMFKTIVATYEEYIYPFNSCPFSAVEPSVRRLYIREDFFEAALNDESLDGEIKKQINEFFKRSFCQKLLW